MKKRALTILLAFALLAVLLSPAALAEAGQTDSADVSEYVLHLGGLLPEAEMLPRVKYVGNEAALKQALYQGLCARQQTIDVRNYMVSPSEIAEIYRQVLNDNPDLFYVNGGLTWNYSGA